MRLFAAVDPPTDACSSLTDVLGDERDDRLRWVPPEQWHLTLAFYGEVDDRRAEPLQSGLERAAARTRPFGIRLSGAGTFPRQSVKARVVWIGLDGETDAIRRLADRCAGAGRRARITMEDRAFRAHLTLARARQGAVDAGEVVARLATYTGPWWTVTSLRLVRSHLGSVVRHETVREFALAEPLTPK